MYMHENGTHIYEVTHKDKTERIYECTGCDEKHLNKTRIKMA
jgi:hypothetical protein